VGVLAFFVFSWEVNKWVQYKCTITYIYTEPIYLYSLKTYSESYSNSRQLAFVLYTCSYAASEPNKFIR